MTSYPQQFLYLGDADGCPHEVVNGARTAYNLTTRGQGDSYGFSNILDDLGCAALAYVPICGTNLLDREQSTLEVYVDGWNIDANCTITASTAAYREGTHSLRVVAAAGGDMSIMTPNGISGKPVVGGVSYTARASSRAASTGRDFGVWIEWYDISGTYISWSSATDSPDSSTGWTEHVVTATAPVNAAYAALGAYWVGAGAGEVHYFDRAGIMVGDGTGGDMVWVPGDDGISTGVGWGQWIVDAPDDPWDNGATAASDALGIVIEEWTGIDGGHHTRATTTLGINRGGAALGAMSQRGRVMKFNVLLVGTSERGMNHLFRWLERELLDCGAGCTERSLWLRETCPTVGDASYAELEVDWLRLDRVGLVEGPTWEAAPVKDAGGCYIRRASFTIVAGDPCMYGVPAAVASGTSTNATVSLSATLTEAACDEWTSSNRQVSAYIEPADTGMMLPQIIISSLEYSGGGDPYSLPDLRIFGVLEPAYGSIDLCSAEKVGQLVLSGLNASGAEILIDFAERRVWTRRVADGSDWQDGSMYLALSETAGFPRWFDFGALGGYVYVEPMYEGLANSLSGTADDVDEWYVEIRQVQRVGCI